MTEIRLSPFEWKYYKVSIFIYFSTHYPIHLQCSSMRISRRARGTWADLWCHRRHLYTYGRAGGRPPTCHSKMLLLSCSISMGVGYWRGARERDAPQSCILLQSSRLFSISLFSLHRTPIISTLCVRMLFSLSFLFSSTHLASTSPLVRCLNWFTKSICFSIIQKPYYNASIIDSKLLLSIAKKCYILTTFPNISFNNRSQSISHSIPVKKFVHLID